jgi:tRNA A-37 threonylcarbamoyl transferase component Bud32
MPERLAAATVEATSPSTCAGESGDAERAAAASGTGPDAAEEEAVLAPGERAGDFVIAGLLGRGSFGTVYAAAHAVIGRRAAVKVLREQTDERKVAAFIEEARLVARLRHPNIVDVLTFGRLDDGRHVQVMDLIEGPTLAEHIAEHGPSSLTDALPILRGVASALDAVHRSGVAHRDLKPANVMLERTEGELVPKLIDFGIAQLIAAESEGEREGERPAAARGGVVGTPRYMAPEQCRGRAVDARADSYAFGLLAYELLTGEPPFGGDDTLELMMKHTSEVPVAPSLRCTTLPAAVDPILLGLLAKDPVARPLELVPVVRALAAVAAPATPVATATARPLQMAVAVLAGGLVIAAVVALTGRETTSPPARGDSPREVTISAASPPAPAVTTATPVVALPAPSPVEPSPAASPSAPRRASSAVKPPRPAPRSSSAPGLEDPENPFGPR